MFCTVDDVAALLMLEISDSDKVQACTRAIDEATAAIQNYCHQELEYTENDVLTLDCPGGSKIFLPELPVVSVSTVVENGVTLTATIDYKLGQFGILYRVGRNWAAGVQNVTVMYTHGYADFPDDILGVCTRAASRIYQAGLRAKEQNGIVGVANMALGDYQVGYASEAGGGVGEGVMGVSAARMLLLSEKDILNRYRHIGQ
ncbi:MAG TPA: hypothetical protein DDW19_01865 [Anaerolineaceae bacterium]|jgi:hypothetical protein|nr:hypothetical protein [Anaerolineaceae bacterium]